MDDRLTDIALRSECAHWWPDGFSELSVEHFRAYLYEMVVLGCLHPIPAQVGICVPRTYFA